MMEVCKRGVCYIVNDNKGRELLKNGFVDVTPKEEPKKKETKKYDKED